MATNTPVYDFDREDPGADGWTDRMNGNFTDIETLLTGGTVNGSQQVESGTNVDGTTIADIQTAIDNKSYVKLKPGTTYTGSTTLTVDLTTDGVVIDAYGATINGQGVVLDISGPNLYPATERAFVFGGVWRSDAANGSRAIKVTDALNNWIWPTFVADAEEGVEVRNETSFSESNWFRINESQNVDNMIAFRGQSTTGGTGGTDSFNGTRIELLGGHWNELFDETLSPRGQNQKGYGIYTSNAALYQSYIDTHIFYQGGRALMRADGSFRNTWMRLNAENTDTGALDGTGSGVIEGNDAGLTSFSDRPYPHPIDYRFLRIGTAGSHVKWDISQPWLSPQNDGSNFSVKNLSSEVDSVAQFFRVEGNGLKTASFDLSGTSATDREIRFHNGADANPEGYYRYDDGASQWVKIEDNTVTITPA